MLLQLLVIFMYIFVSYDNIIFSDGIITLRIH